MFLSIPSKNSNQHKITRISQHSATLPDCILPFIAYSSLNGSTRETFVMHFIIPQPNRFNLHAHTQILLGTPRQHFTAQDVVYLGRRFFLSFPFTLPLKFSKKYTQTWGEMQLGTPKQTLPGRWPYPTWTLFFVRSSIISRLIFLFFYFSAFRSRAASSSSGATSASVCRATSTRTRTRSRTLMGSSWRPNSWTLSTTTAAGTIRSSVGWRGRPRPGWRWPSWAGCWCCRGCCSAGGVGREEGKEWPSEKNCNERRTVFNGSWGRRLRHETKVHCLMASGTTLGRVRNKLEIAYQMLFDLTKQLIQLSVVTFFYSDYFQFLWKTEKIHSFDFVNLK